MKITIKKPSRFVQAAAALIISVALAGFALVSFIHRAADFFGKPDLKQAPLNNELLLGAYSFEIRDAVARLNAPLMMVKLKEGNMNFYNYLIWHIPSDWDDLEIFLKKSTGKNITVIVDLAPPWGTDPKKSEPFKTDYVKWAQELAKLSLKYPQLIGYSIDDWYFISSIEPKNVYPSYSPQEVDSGRLAAKAINPNFKFYPTVYNNCKKGMDEKNPVDGVLIYPEGVISSNDFPKKDMWKEAISSCKNIFPNDTIAGIYSVTVEGFEQKYADETDNKDADIVAQKVNLALEQAPRGVMMYGLQWHGTVWDRVTSIFASRLPQAK